MYKIVFEPSGITCENVSEEETILCAAQRSGENIAAVCGGAGVCGRCKVKIIEGVENISPISKKENDYLTDEEKKNNIRLACMTYVKGNIRIEIPEENRIAKQIVLSGGKMKKIDIKPCVRAYTVTLERATLSDNRDDMKRLCDALSEKKAFSNNTPEIDFAVLKKLSSVIRKGRWKVTAVVWNEKKIIGVFPGENIEMYGIAIDIGTTTIAAFLCNLRTGETVQTSSMMNPQVKYGDDVLARVSYSMMNENGLQSMHNVLIKGIEKLVYEMAEKERIDKKNIAEVVFAGNTVMQHIALCIPPDSIGVSPFIASSANALNIPAREIGLDLMDGANIYCLPSEAGFVGADNVAVLIAEEPYKSDKTKLIVDIGTNSEICFGNKEKLYITSCATGPALEGAQIQCGMRAAKGAIEHIKINPDTLEPHLSVIGGDDVVPLGICGSGIIDAVAQMAVSGILTENGKFSNCINSNRVRQNSTGKMEYVLYFAKNEKEHDIVVTAKDVRAVQLAKAALYAAAKLIIKKSGMTKPSEVILAGAFGSYIDPQSVIDMGMLPFEKKEDIIVSGNAAGVGARYALINSDKRSDAERIAKDVIFMETAAESEFQKEFADAMCLKKMNLL